MIPILRSVGAVILGVVAAGILIAGIQYLGHRLYPPPPGVDMSDIESVKVWLPQAPFLALLPVLVAYAVGTFVGAWLAARLAGRAPLLHGLILGALFLVAGIMNLRSLPHPTWFWAPNIAEFPVAAFLGAWMARRR